MSTPHQQLFGLQNELNAMEEMLQSVQAAASGLLAGPPRPPDRKQGARTSRAENTASSSWAKSKMQRRWPNPHDVAPSEPIGEDGLQRALQHTRTTQPTLVKYVKPRPQANVEPVSVPQAYNPDVAKSSQVRRTIAYSFSKADTKSQSAITRLSSQPTASPIACADDEPRGDATTSSPARHRTAGDTEVQSVLADSISSEVVSTQPMLLQPTSGYSFAKADRFGHTREMWASEADYTPTIADPHRFARVKAPKFSAPVHNVAAQASADAGMSGDTQVDSHALAAALEPNLNILSTKRSAPAHSFGVRNQNQAVMRAGSRDSTPGPGHYDTQKDQRLQWVESRPPPVPSNSQPSLPAAVQELLFARKWEKQNRLGPGYYDSNLAMSRTRPRSASASFGVGERGLSLPVQQPAGAGELPRTNSSKRGSSGSHATTNIGGINAESKTDDEDDDSISSLEINHKVLSAYFDEADAIWKVLDDSDLDREQKRLRVRQAKRKRKHGITSTHRATSQRRPSSAPSSKRVQGFNFAPQSKAITWKNREIIQRRRSEEYLRRSIGPYDVNTSLVDRSIIGGPRYDAEVSFQQRKEELLRTRPGVLETVLRKSTAATEQQDTFLGPQLQPIWAAGNERTTVNSGSRSIPSEEVYRHSGYAHTKRPSAVMKVDPPIPLTVQQMRQAIAAEQAEQEKWLSTQLQRPWTVDDDTVHRLYDMRAQLGREYKLVRSKGRVQRVSRYEYEARDKIGPLRYDYDEPYQQQPMAVDFSRAAGREDLFGPFGEKPAEFVVGPVVDELLDGLSDPREGTALDLQPNEDVLSRRRKVATPSFSHQRGREEAKEPRGDDTEIEDARMAFMSIQQSVARRKGPDFSKMRRNEETNAVADADLLHEAAADILGHALAPPPPSSPPAPSNTMKQQKSFTFSAVERFEKPKPAASGGEFMLSPRPAEARGRGAVEMQKQMGRADERAEDALLLQSDALWREVYGLPDRREAADVAAETDARIRNGRANLSTCLRSSFAVDMMHQAARFAPRQPSVGHRLSYDVKSDALLPQPQATSWAKQPSRFSESSQTIDPMLDKPVELIVSPKPFVQSQYKSVSTGPAWSSTKDTDKDKDKDRLQAKKTSETTQGNDFYDYDPNYKFARPKGGIRMDQQRGREPPSTAGHEAVETDMRFSLEKQGDVLILDPYPATTTANTRMHVTSEPAKRGTGKAVVEASVDARPAQSVLSTKGVTAEPDPQQMLSLLESLGI